jgi:hypothetical protein
VQLPVSRHIFKDLAEVAEAHGGVDPLGHLGRLQARRSTAAGERVVDVEGGVVGPTEEVRRRTDDAQR